MGEHRFLQFNDGNQNGWRVCQPREHYLQVLNLAWVSEESFLLIDCFYEIGNIFWCSLCLVFEQHLYFFGLDVCVLFNVDPHDLKAFVFAVELTQAIIDDLICGWLSVQTLPIDDDSPPPERFCLAFLRTI